MNTRIVIFNKCIIKNKPLCCIKTQILVSKSRIIFPFSSTRLHLFHTLVTSYSADSDHVVLIREQLNICPDNWNNNLITNLNQTLFSL